MADAFIEAEIEILVKEAKRYVDIVWPGIEPDGFVSAVAFAVCEPKLAPRRVLLAMPGMSINQQRDVLERTLPQVGAFLVCVINECVAVNAKGSQQVAETLAHKRIGTLHELPHIDVIQLIVEGPDVAPRIFQAEITIVDGKRVLGEYVDITPDLKAPYPAWRRYFPCPPGPGSAAPDSLREA